MKYGVIGWPVEHSRSPQMHRAAFSELGIDATYDAVPIAPTELLDRLNGLQLDGFNVTLPHKIHIMGWVDELDPAARAVGAVNTVYRRDDVWVGTNTDAVGLRYSLEEAGVDVAACRVVVLGSGGAARSALYGLRDARERVVVARRFGAAGELARDFGVIASEWKDLASAFTDATLVVQATSATLGDDAETFAEALPFDALSNATVLDLVYTPRETTVLKRAREHGLSVVDGTGMLVHQGAAAFELWTGRPAPVEAMRAALLASL